MTKRISQQLIHAATHFAEARQTSSKQKAIESFMAPKKIDDISVNNEDTFPIHDVDNIE